LQFSARSHAPADDRQTVDEGSTASAGQAAELPLQVSATSQAPPEPRQVNPEG
jgi:hypothetical protein